MRKLWYGKLNGSNIFVLEIDFQKKNSKQNLRPTYEATKIVGEPAMY